MPDHLPPLPRGPVPGIGCVGAGFIMADCRLVASARAGIHPVEITSRRATLAVVEAAYRSARKHRAVCLREIDG